MLKSIISLLLGFNKQAPLVRNAQSASYAISGSFHQTSAKAGARERHADFATSASNAPTPRAQRMEAGKKQATQNKPQKIGSAPTNVTRRLNDFFAFETGNEFFDFTFKAMDFTLCDDLSF